MQMRSLVLISLLAFFTLTCQKRSERLITGNWVFAVDPPENLNNYQGFTENRSVFDGSETVSFNSDGRFGVNGVTYGSWTYDHKKKEIYIVQDIAGGYSCCGIVQTTMNWEITRLKQKELQVDHPYYKYENNAYSFKKVD